MRSIELGLRPALFAGYRDLTALRYDFPLVLIRAAPAQASVQSLSGLFDGALEGDRRQGSTASGCASTRCGSSGRSARWPRNAHERIAVGAVGPRRRALSAQGRRIAAEQPRTPARRAQARRRSGRLRRRCRPPAPARLARGAGAEGAQFRADIGSAAPEALRHPAGGLRPLAGGHERASGSRRRSGRRTATPSTSTRCRACSPRTSPKADCRRAAASASACAACRCCRRSASSAGRPKATNGSASPSPTAFVFDNCADARRGLPRAAAGVVELAKAIAIAELEIEGDYSEARHDAFFADFGANGLDPEDLALFPGLPGLPARRRLQRGGNRHAAGGFPAGLPVKVLVQTDDMLEESSIRDGHFALGAAQPQLASTAIGLDASTCCSRELEPVPAARADHARAGLSRARRCSASSPAPAARHPAALSHGRGGDGVARVSGVHLRPVGGRRTGRRASRSSQSAGRARLADRSVSTTRTKSTSAYRGRRVHAASISSPAIRATPGISPVPRAKWNATWCRSPNG